MEYNLLRASKMEFTDDSHLHLVLENTIIAQTRSHEIVEFLEKIVCERCGMNQKRAGTRKTVIFRFSLKSKIY